MNKLKLVIVAETFVLLCLIAFLIYHFSLTGFVVQNQVAYCDKYYYDGGVCLLSPRLYTGSLKPNSMLVFNFDSLKQDISNYINANNLNVSLYVLNMRSGSSFGINSNQQYPSFSLDKLPIAIIILKKVEAKQLSLDTKLIIHDYQRNSGSGTLYTENINEMTVKDLLYYMLSESDNTALNVLQAQITIQDLQHLSSYLNYYPNGVYFSNYFSQDVNETVMVTPKTAINAFISLYLSTDLKPEDSELVLNDLMNTSVDMKKYAQLPENITLVHKYADYYDFNSEFFHDCGIMYIGESRILYCIMTEGISRSQAPEVTGNIINKIYNYVEPKE